MAGTYIIGEKKVRPGAYFNITKKSEGTTPDIISGIVACVFKSDFGPLGTVAELSSGEGYEKTFGTGGTTDTLKEAFNGGAVTLFAVRLGNGGTAASVTLNDDSGEGAVKIAGNYPGAKEFSVTVREKITDSTVKQCIIYSGNTEFENIEFDAGENEAENLVKAFQQSSSFTAQLVSDEKVSSKIAAILQYEFLPGTDPETTVSDYSNAFTELESYEFNTICVDTNDIGVHLLMHSFIDRVYNAGKLIMGVVAEGSNVDYEKRLEHALSYNDYRMHYILNAHCCEADGEIDGYQTAARIAGMIAAVPSNKSLTHSVLNGVSRLLERLTNTNIITAELSGCIVLSVNSDKQVWIDSAINTLVTPDEDRDAGWKKIRRVKTRFEMMRRVNIVADSLVGKVDNDSNGRKTILSQIQEVGTAMISEGKLVRFSCYEDEAFVSDGDEAFFRIDVVDKDSAEHIYLRYQFQFSSIAG